MKNCTRYSNLKKSDFTFIIFSNDITLGRQNKNPSQTIRGRKERLPVMVSDKIRIELKGFDSTTSIQPF